MPERAVRGTGRASGAVWMTTVCPDACRLGCQWLRVVRSAMTQAALFLNGSCGHVDTHISSACGLQSVLSGERSLALGCLCTCRTSPDHG